MYTILILLQNENNYDMTEQKVDKKKEMILHMANITARYSYWNTGK